MSNRLSTKAADAWTTAFYGLTATAALVGQVWAASERLPGHLPQPIPALIMTPIVSIIEVGGVAMAARADLRRRLGETATGYRILSAIVAVFAVLFNWFGHYQQGVPSWWSWLFAGLSALGYSVWLLHSGDRRRDALRADGKLATTPPVYGIVRWIRQPGLTRLARNLALAHGYGLYESLTAARQQVRDDTRRTALAGHLRTLIKARHDNPLLAAIVTTTYDLDRLADEIAAHADYEGWAREIGAQLAPNPPKPATVERTSGRRKPRPTADRVARAAARTPEARPTELAARLGLTEDTVRRHLRQLPAFANPTSIAHVNGHSA
jgi:hypothetical protein